MKTKSFSKKLILNKETVSNLGNEKMSGVKGGETYPDCPTIYDLTCPLHNTCRPFLCAETLKCPLLP
jgi:hypothetical protein